MRHRFPRALALCFIGCAARPIERVDPPADLLQTTRAHELGGRWSNSTEVCVAGDGSVASSRTIYSSGDPWLDEIYRETLAKWRFKPTSSQRCRKLRFDEDFGPDRRPLAPANPTSAAMLGAPKRRLPLVAFRAIHKPEPPLDHLRAIAEAAGISNWTLVNRTSFCVRPDGTVEEVRTLRSTGVVEVDRLMRATVSTWKFARMTPDGSPGCVETELSFVIRIN